MASNTDPQAPRWNIETRKKLLSYAEVIFIEWIFDRIRARRQLYVLVWQSFFYRCVIIMQNLLSRNTLHKKF